MTDSKDNRQEIITLPNGKKGTRAYEAYLLDRKHQSNKADCWVFAVTSPIMVSGFAMPFFQPSEASEKEIAAGLLASLGLASIGFFSFLVRRAHKSFKASQANPYDPNDKGFEYKVVETVHPGGAGVGGGACGKSIFLEEILPTGDEVSAPGP